MVTVAALAGAMMVADVVAAAITMGPAMIRMQSSDTVLGILAAAVVAHGAVMGVIVAMTNEKGRGDDRGHRKDAPPAGGTAGIPVSFNDGNQPLAPDGGEDAFPLASGTRNHRKFQ